MFFLISAFIFFYLIFCCFLMCFYVFFIVSFNSSFCFLFLKINYIYVFYLNVDTFVLFIIFGVVFFCLNLLCFSYHY